MEGRGRDVGGTCGRVTFSPWKRNGREVSEVGSRMTRPHDPLCLLWRRVHVFAGGGGGGVEEFGRRWGAVICVRGAGSGKRGGTKWDKWQRQRALLSLPATAPSPSRCALTRRLHQVWPFQAGVREVFLSKTSPAVTMAFGWGIIGPRRGVREWHDTSVMWEGASVWFLSRTGTTRPPLSPSPLLPHLFPRVLQKVQGSVDI